MANKRKEPTKKQKDYAASIAKTLNIKLPEENTSAAYRDFIEKNQERFSQSRVRAVHYTDEQIARANAVDILDYARSQGLELKRDGKSYRVKNYSGGFIITPEKNNWNWFDGNTGGGVIQLCMFLENKTWPEAVGALLNEDMEPIRRRPDWKPVEEPPKEFHLPERNDTNKHVYAYLTKTRGIDTEIVKKMLDQGYIYENNRRSCVFVGRDKEGVPRHASVRSTNTVGDAYKKDVSGSQKKFSFSISGTSGNLNVFEAPIDALSYMSLQKMGKKPVNDSYLALGGVTDKALEQYLIDHKDIRKITVCTDGDEAGEKAAERIKEKYGTDYEIVRQRSSHKDFNEDLINVVQEENFKRNLHEVVSGKSRVSDSILIGTTPNILVACGATKGVDFTISKTVIDKCTRPEIRDADGKLTGKTGHGLTEEQLYSALMNVKEPIMVLKGNRENSLVVVTEYSDDKNRPIVVSVVLDKKSGRTMINNVSSVYGRDKFEEYLGRQIQADNILAFDNKKAEPLLQPIGKWYPKRGEVISYDATIAYSMESVNIVNENNAEEIEEKSQILFERWGEQYSELTSNFDFNETLHQSNNIVKENKGKDKEVVTEMHSITEESNVDKKATVTEEKAQEKPNDQTLVQEEGEHSMDNSLDKDTVKKENMVKLQGIPGYQKGTPAKDLKIGDVLVWNGGVTSEVVGLEPSKTGKTILFQMKSGEDGVVRDRRMKAGTLVVVQENGSTTNESEKVEEFAAKLQQHLRDHNENFNESIGVIVKNLESENIADYMEQLEMYAEDLNSDVAELSRYASVGAEEEAVADDAIDKYNTVMDTLMQLKSLSFAAEEQPKPDISISNYESNKPGQIDFDVNIEDEVHKGQAGFEDDGTVNWIFVDPVPLNKDKKGIEQQDSAKVELDWDKIIEKVTKLLQDLWNKSKEFVHTLRSHTNRRTYTQTVQSGALAESGNSNQAQQRPVQNTSQDKSLAEQERKSFDNAGVAEKGRNTNIASTGSSEIPEAAVTSETPSDVTEQNTLPYYLNFTDMEIKDGYLHFIIETPNHDELQGTYRIVWSEDGKANELINIRNSYRYPELKEHWKEIRNECQKSVNAHDEYIMENNFQHYIGEDEEPWPLNIGQVPNILVICGASNNLRFDISQDIIAGTLKQGITEEQLMNALNNVKNPVMVIQGKEENSFIVVTDYCDNQGHPIMLSLEERQEKGFNRGMEVKGVYSQREFAAYVANQVADSKVLAVDHSKADALFQSLEEKSPVFEQVIRFDESIAYDKDSVKIPPTKKQFTFAKQIAETMSLKLPEEYSKEAYAAFIGDNAEEFKNTPKPKDEAKHETKKADIPFQSIRKNDTSEALKKLQDEDRINTEVIEELEKMEKTEEVSQALSEAYEERKRIDERTVELTWNTNQQEKAAEYRSFSDNHKQFISERKANRIPIVINAFGGPGSGKSASCMDICQQLKKQGYNAEYVQEYAKELVYDENREMLDGTPEHQFEVLKEQLRRVDRLYGSVDFIVTDSPVLLNGVYNKELTPEYDSMLDSLYNDFENFTYFVERDTSAYQQKGRIQNLDQSQKIDQDVKQLLKDKDIYYGTYNYDAIDKIVYSSIRTFNRVNHIEEAATQKQIAYAKKIAGALKIDLPEEATKAAYKAFISEHQEAFSQNGNPVMEKEAGAYQYKDYLDMVTQDGSKLKDVPKENYTDELLLAAVSNWGAAIQFIPEEKVTKDIAMASVRQYGLNLKHVPAGFRSEDICIAAYISSSGKSLRYTPGDIKAQVKEQGQKQLAEDNNANPNTKRQLEVKQLQKQGQEWSSKLDNMLKEHETDPEAMVEDIAFASKFYQYSIRNIQLMLRQNPGITYVASASTFKKMGYHVKENETPMLGRIPVYAKYIVNEKEERVYSWNYTPEIRQKLKEGTLTEKEALRKFQFVAAFFDISQTDCPAEDYPSVFHMGVPSELHQEAFDAMKEFAESLGFKVMVTDLKSISLRGNCEPDKKIIRINDKLESTMALSTLCHEIAHGIIHTSENSAKMSTAQKECEADVMDVMLESSLGLPINESRRNHLFNAFNAYKKEEAAKEHPYEVTLEKLIDRVQTKVFRPYAEDINCCLDRHLPAEGIQNEKEAEAVIKNIALLDSVYETNHRDYIDEKNELFDAGRMENYQELYQQTREEYRLNNSFVPKLAMFKEGGGVYNLCDVQFLDETMADLLKSYPEAITSEVLPINAEVGNILALKENVLEHSRLYLVTGQGLEDITEALQEKFAAGFMENKINCGFDAVTEYQCIYNILQNGIKLEPVMMKRCDHLCETFGFSKNVAIDSGMQLMARINLVTEGLSQNNRELIAEYVFRTGNFKKAEEYAEKLEKEPDITKKLLQEMKLVDSYKYMLWTIAEYENSNAVSKENRITTGAYNTSAIPVLSENVHSLSQINESFLLIRKHASPESTKYYAIARNQDGYRIAYVELNGYRPEITYSAVTFAGYEEAKEFYNQYLETSNSRLVDETQVGELAVLEHKENQVALSDITTIGKTIASQKHQYKEPGMSEEGALELLRLDIRNEYPDIRPIEPEETDHEIQVLKDFKTKISSYGEERFIELCNLKDFTDTAVMEESIQLAGWLTEQRDVLDNINITGMDDVKQCVNAALECSVTAADIEQAFNVIDSAVLSSEFSNLETEFEGFEEYNNVLTTLKASHVTPDKYCYADYDAAPGPFLYTSDLAGNIYRKSLRNEWNGSVRELYNGLKENGYEICTSLDDFKAYAANNRLGIINASEKEKNEAYIRILESASDMLPKNRILSVYDFKNTVDKLYSGSMDFHEGITYKLVTRKDQEIHSYIDTYSGNDEQNVFEQLYGKVQEQVPELSKVISKQYYQDQVNFNENHLVRPLMVQLKKQQKPVADSEELNALMDSNDKLKEEIKKLDLSPADAELLKLNAGNIQTEQIANIARQQQMDQQIRQQKVRNQQQMEISV